MTDTAQEWLNVHKTTALIVDFLEWQRQESLDLTPYYQRRSVWTPRAKSLLIDSILRGYPIPLIFLHNRLDIEKSRTVRQVVDGQQRLRTILAYVDKHCLSSLEPGDDFAVLKTHNPEFHGLSFKQLPADVQTRFLQTTLSINFLPSDIDDVTVLTIFQRMNSTGLKLNAQEIRNATWFGEFKESSYDLAYSQNQRWIEWGVFSRQDIAQMKEVELTADLMGYLVGGVQARTKAAIERLYKSFDKDFRDRQQVEERFAAVFDSLGGVYGREFERSHLRRFRRPTWFYAVFAVTADVLARGEQVAPARMVDALESAEIELRSEHLDAALQKTLRGATSDRKSRELRVSFIQRKLAEA